jgi:hypothetical protein
VDLLLVLDRRKQFNGKRQVRLIAPTVPASWLLVLRPIASAFHLFEVSRIRFASLGMLAIIVV